jgi:RNA ligase (TIGR02306 family)
MTRKLATIEVVKALLPIPGADRIELALIKGWQVVVKKGEFAVGDQAVYFEIDSWIPNTIAPFLTKEGYAPKEYGGVQGERLKTIKLKKQISQGLLLPLAGSMMTKFGNSPEFLKSGLAEGTDVTEALGIQKWEAPEEKNANTSLMPSKTREFPYFIKKTDQERVQNYGHLVVRELDTVFEASMKKDGSSMTVFRVNPDSEYYADAKKLLGIKDSLWTRLKIRFFGGKQEPVFGICSRNVLLPLEGNSNFHKAAAPLLAYLCSGASKMTDGSIALQGEVVAPDIQGNYEKVSGVEFHLFDIFDIDEQKYYLPGERRLFAGISEINHATVVAEGTLREILGLKDGDDVVQKALTFASGKGDNEGVMREGIVFKAYGRDFSFKAISNEYLLHKG